MFSMFYGPGGSKSRLAKAAGAEPSGHVRGQKLHAAVARSTFLRFSKQKCAKRFSFGVLLEVEMLKRRAIMFVCFLLFFYFYLRAAAPAADPGKEKPVMVSAGFVRVFCESSAWMLYIYIIYIYASNSIYLYVEVKFC